MKFLNNSLQSKLFLIFFSLGGGASALLFIVGFMGVASLEDTRTELLQLQAQSTTKCIDRFNFERFGDASVFSTNSSFTDSYESWGDDEQRLSLIEILNRYVDAYDSYHLLMLINKKGQLVAINSADKDGKSIEVDSLYERSFAKDVWFERAVQLSKARIANDPAAGVKAESPDFIEYLAPIYGDNAAGVAISAPMFNKDGETIGVWCSILNLDVIESIVQDTYKDLKAMGLPESDLSIVDSKGTLIYQFDPSNAESNASGRNRDVVFQRNILNDGDESFGAIIREEKGSIASTFNSRRQNEFSAGFSSCGSVPAFESLGWRVVVQVPSTVAHAYASSLRWLMTGTFTIGLTLLAIASYFTARKIVTPLREAIIMLTRLRCGDFARRLPMTRTDELGQMCRGFNLFADQMQKVIESAHEKSSAASESAIGVSDRLSDACNATSSVSDNMREVAASLSQMKTTIAEISKTAANSSNIAEKAANLVEQSNRRILQLDSAACEIGSVIELIQEIAEQTNLLALNATIEAARAGAAGKGFAVVATEVKDLSRQTAQATDDIRNRITAIQAEARLSIDSMKEIAEVVGQARNSAFMIASAVEEQTVTSASMVERVASTASAATLVSEGVAHSAQISREINGTISEIDRLLAMSSQDAASNPECALIL